MPLSAEDRLDIQELMAQYANAVDVDGREEDLYEIFTDDAVLDSPMSGKFAGREGLKRFGRVVGQMRVVEIGRHFITNLRIKGDGDRATFKAYFFHSSTPRDPVSPGARRATTVSNAGCYDCAARKIGGRWWLERRTVFVDNC